VIPESQNAKPSCGEISIAVQILRGPSVLPAIRFYYNLLLKCDKIDNPSSYWNLATKFYGCELSRAQ